MDGVKRQPVPLSDEAVTMEDVQVMWSSLIVDGRLSMPFCRAESHAWLTSESIKVEQTVAVDWLSTASLTLRPDVVVVVVVD